MVAPTMFIFATPRAVLRTVPHKDANDYVFSTTGAAPISGFSKGKAALDAAAVKIRTNGTDGSQPEPITPWRLHDLRRTGVTTLARLGFDSIVADKLLAHKPAKLRGVAAVYQRHDFGAERARALDVWAAHVLQCADSSADFN